MKALLELVDDIMIGDSSSQLILGVEFALKLLVCVKK
jgi:hypothetical protein